VLFVLAVLLHYATVLSRVSDQNVILAQRLALLELELNRRGRTTEPSEGAAVGAPAKQGS
jgi:hypothetical protein